MNPYLELLQPVLVALRQLEAHVQDATYDMSAYQQQLLERLNDFEQQALSRGLNMEDVRYAQYALVAMMDEWISQTIPGQACDWVSNPLQFQLFSDAEAGSRFFRQLEQLRQDAHAHIPLLEVYYLCMVLGYQGSYRFGSQGELLHIRSDLLAQIQRVRSPQWVSPQETSAPSTPELEKPLEAKSKWQQWLSQLHRSVMGKNRWLLASGVFLFLYLGLQTAISIKASHSRARLQDMNMRAGGHHVIVE